MIPVGEGGSREEGFHSSSFRGKHGSYLYKMGVEGSYCLLRDDEN